MNNKYNNSFGKMDIIYWRMWMAVPNYFYYFNKQTNLIQIKSSLVCGNKTYDK